MWSPYLVCSYTLAEAIAVTNKREECRGLYIAFVDSTLTLGQLSTALPSGWLLETLFDGNIGHMFAATGFICGGVTTVSPARCPVLALATCLSMCCLLSDADRRVLCPLTYVVSKREGVL
mmetsp:Transcript_12234/g.28719  ORF Transcript_12234/g.28719 Transcript_12234/m.28719 type:complete len:120 (-) Transcript_12234:220-579(-)